MSGPFGALEAAASGVHLSRVWMDAIADNLANLNTVRPAGTEPFRARLVEAAPDPAGGVRVVRISADPSNPLAGPDGYVARPVVDLPTQMTDLVMATRSWQANVSVMAAARDAYRAAIDILRR